MCPVLLLLSPPSDAPKKKTDKSERSGVAERPPPLALSLTSRLAPPPLSLFSFQKPHPPCACLPPLRRPSWPWAPLRGTWVWAGVEAPAGRARVGTGASHSIVAPCGTQKPPRRLCPLRDGRGGAWPALFPLSQCPGQRQGSPQGPGERRWRAKGQCRPAGTGGARPTATPGERAAKTSARRRFRCPPPPLFFAPLSRAAAGEARAPPDPPPLPAAWALS